MTFISILISVWQFFIVLLVILLAELILIILFFVYTDKVRSLYVAVMPYSSASQLGGISVPILFP